MFKTIALAFSLLLPFETQNYTVTGEFHDVRGFTYHEAVDSDGYRLLFADENLTQPTTIKPGDKVTALFMKTLTDEGELFKVIKR